MGYGFHKHTLIYIDAMQRGGITTPSAKNERLIDDMIRQLIFNGCWNDLNYFFLAANDGSLDVCLYNLRQPLLPPGSYGGGVGFVAKKGVYGPGSFVTGFTPVTQSIIPLSGINTSFWAYVTGSNGAAPTLAETYMLWTDASVYQTIRGRTNPRVDCIIGTTSPNPTTIVFTAPQANTLYCVDVSSTRTLWSNKTLTSSASGGGTMPLSGQISFGQNIPSTRQCGAVGGGLSMHSVGRYNNSGGFADTMKTYMDAVQLL